ncbi:hypothetical protein N9M10_02735 [Hellea sp.]|nr:hypothetical protein [Hellea sp.]
MKSRIKNLFSKANEDVALGVDQDVVERVSQKRCQPDSPAIPTKMKRFEAEIAINRLYETAGLPMPLIIWTQSPFESYLAKAAIDVFSQAGQPHPWHYHWWDRSVELFMDFRINAAQSILDSGWRMGQGGTGYGAWDDLPVYKGGNTVLWEDIPPKNSYTSSSTDDTDWTKILDGAGLSSSITEEIEKRGGDMITDMWARYRFQMDHLDCKPIGGSRSMHLRMRRDKRKLLCQKNLSFLPVEITHPRTDNTLRMSDDFIALRELNRHIMPYEYICFVSEPPGIINIDDGMRLHCETGPAISYPDGFQISAWHGVAFPEDWIEQKPEARQAFRIRNAEQRRVACEMIGWDNVLKDMKAKTLNRDKDPEIGELVSLKGFGDDDEKFLRVRCGTGRDFVLPVPPEMTTARQANAWTWGLEADQYTPEVRT